MPAVLTSRMHHPCKKETHRAMQDPFVFVDLYSMERVKAVSGCGICSLGCGCAQCTHSGYLAGQAARDSIDRPAFDVFTYWHSWRIWPLVLGLAHSAIALGLGPLVCLQQPISSKSFSHASAFDIATLFSWLGILAGCCHRAPWTLSAWELMPAWKVVELNCLAISVQSHVEKVCSFDR